MQITSRSLGSVAILELVGRLVTGPGETEVLSFRNAIRQLVVAGRVHVALHVARLASIDARGLGELASALTALRASGGELTLIAPSARVRRLLSVTRLDRLLRVCDSEQEALGAIRGPIPFRPAFQGL